MLLLANVIMGLFKVVVLIIGVIWALNIAIDTWQEQDAWEAGFTAKG